MKDTDLLDSFVDYLKRNGFRDLKVDAYPDEGGKKGSSDVDGIASPFAIEVTSIDTIPDQRRNDDWFMQVVGGLKREIPDIAFRLRVGFDFYAITKGQDWVAIRNAIKNWIIEDAPNLADGRHIVRDIPGVPFLLNVEKKIGRRPGVYFSRLVKPDEQGLSERMRKLIKRKERKLRKYKDQGYTTILLIDGWDFVLMNHAIMLNAIEDAFPDGIPKKIDQIWFAYTDEPKKIYFIDLTPDLKG
jgi:hypothetical protein